MSYDCSDHGRFKVLHLSGEVDLSNSAKVRKCLLEIIEKKYPVIVDFTELKYIDSSGMATLVEGLNLANKKSLDFYIAGANGSPLQVLELTRLNQVFNLIGSVEEVSA